MAHYINVYRPFHGCFGASCSDLWAEDTGAIPALPPDLSVPSSAPATPGTSTAPTYTPSFGHALPWWAWLALGILVTYAALED